MAQKVYKVTVTCRENQTAETVKDMLRTQINPAEIKVGIESVKSLRDGTVHIEAGSVQGPETLTNCIKDKLGDKIETHILRPRKPRLKIIKIQEEIPTDNIEDTIMALNPEICIGKGETIPKFIYETKRHTHLVKCTPILQQFNVINILTLHDPYASLKKEVKYNVERWQFLSAAILF